MINEVRILVPLVAQLSANVYSNEYLYKFFHRKEIPILLAISVEVELYYLPNVFPNGHIILIYLENYTT